MGINGEKTHLVNFHLHLPHLLHHHDHLKGVPKGCMVVMVGREGEEQLQRFVIPVLYINHPLFMQLLKKAEEEYGFDHRGPIIIPCDVEQFRSVQGLIDEEHHHKSLHRQAEYSGPDHHHVLCFKA